MEHERLTAGTGDSFVERMKPLGECLEALAPNARRIVDSHYRERQTCRTIAERIGMRVEAVKKRLQRARADLRRCIDGKLQACDHDA